MVLAHRMPEEDCLARPGARSWRTLLHLRLPDLNAAGSAVVNVNSTTGVTGQGGTLAHVVAKAAQFGLAGEWGTDLAPLGCGSTRSCRQR